MVKFILFITIFSFPFITKYTFVQHNQYEQIPLIYRALDSQYLKADWSINLNTQFSPRVFYTWYMALLSHSMTLPRAYFVNYIFYITAIALSTYILSFLLSRSKKAALLTAIFFLYSQPVTLGNTNVLGRDLDPPRLAFGLVFLGFSALITERFYTAAILFGLSAFIHPLIGFEVPLLFYIASLTIRSRLRNLISSPASGKPLLKSFFIYIGVSVIPLFGYLKMFSTGGGITRGTRELATIITKVAAPFHYSATTFPLLDYIKFFILVIIFILASVKMIKIIARSHFELIYRVLSLIFFLCLAGYLFVDIIPLYAVILAQLFRLTIPAHWLMATLIYSFCFLKVLERKKSVGGGLILGMLPFVLANADYLLISPIKSIFYILLAIFTVLFLMYGDKISSVLTFTRQARNYILLLSLLPVLFILSLPYRHYRLNLDKPYPFMTDEIKISLWVKDNIKSEEVFLIPPYFMRFRLVSGKPVVADRMVIPFMASGILDWMERMRDVSGLRENMTGFIHEQLIYDGYNRMDSERVNFLRDKYGISYLIMQSANKLPFEMIHEDLNYVIYKV